MEGDRWVYEVVLGSSLNFTLHVVAPTMGVAITAAVKHMKEHEGSEEPEVISAKKLSGHTVLLTD